MNYKKILDVLDVKLEELINDLVLDNPYKSTRAEEKIIAYCSARKYLITKYEQEQIENYFGRTDEQQN
jgi:hypothetical protein